MTDASSRARHHRRWLGGRRAAGSLAEPSPASASPTASGGPEILPLLILAEITKGPNRFLFSLTDRQSKLVAAPDVKVHLLFYDVDTAPDTVVFEADARFLWAIEGTAGLYVANVDFPTAGRWGTLFEATFPDGRTKVVRADYDVREPGTTPALGAKPPLIATPTLADVGGDLKPLTTDSDPDPRFYETSIADALVVGQAVRRLVRHTGLLPDPTCGPTLETVKRSREAYPDVTFINVEPYKMALTDGSLQPGARCARSAPGRRTGRMPGGSSPSRTRSIAARRHGRREVRGRARRGRAAGRARCPVSRIRALIVVLVVAVRPAARRPQTVAGFVIDVKSTSSPRSTASRCGHRTGTELLFRVGGSSSTAGRSRPVTCGSTWRLNRRSRWPTARRTASGSPIGWSTRPGCSREAPRRLVLAGSRRCSCPRRSSLTVSSADSSRRYRSPSTLPERRWR